jgi:acetolactate synthase-1/2/3 large subunit
VIEALHDVTGGEATLATDVGQHQMWAAHYYPLERPRRWLTSGGLGTMGYGLPAAIGAQIGRPDDLVIGISGDGSIQMCMQEMTTAAAEELPIKMFVLNNGYLGMVRQWQELFFDRRYSGVALTGNPDFAALAEAHGAMSLRCAGRADLRDTIERALEMDGPVLVDVPVAEEENVYPFIPAGRSVNELIECPT